MIVRSGLAVFLTRMSGVVDTAAAVSSSTGLPSLSTTGLWSLDTTTGSLHRPLMLLSEGSLASRRDERNTSPGP